ncbi:hypothetical protein ACTXGQ_13715 [Marinobacter sp. 1Y8]
MPAPVKFSISEHAVLPQRACLRNDDNDSAGRPKRTSPGQWGPIAVILAAFGLLGEPASVNGAIADWHYDPQRDSRMTRCSSLSAPGTPEDINPVVLPQPQWHPKKPGRNEDRGWYLIQPAFTTDTTVGYRDSRDAVQIAQSQQDADLAKASNTSLSQDHLPEALRGFVYRIDFGIEYRF